MYLSSVALIYNFDPNQNFNTLEKANEGSYYRLLSFAFSKIYLVKIFTKLQPNSVTAIFTRK